MDYNELHVRKKYRSIPSVKFYVRHYAKGHACAARHNFDASTEKKMVVGG